MTIPREFLAVALFASLTACSGSTDVEETGSTDTGSTDTGETTDSGEDTDTGPTSYCGDGIVDDGEACDEGTDNSATGSCSTDCDWNGWVTCDVVTGSHYTLDATTIQPDGSFHVADRFTDLAALSTACPGDATHNAVVSLTLPAAGTWMLSTDNVQTTVPTALSLRTDCDDRSEISCSVGGTSAANASQVAIVDGLAGDTYVAVVELVGTEVGNWHLSLSSVTGVASEGDACSDTEPCEDGTVCTDDQCLPIEGPAITSQTIRQVDTYQYQVTVTGTDKNHDATNITIPGFEDIYADVWGDVASEPAFPAEDVSWTWSGDTFTAKFIAPISFIDTGMADVVTLDVFVQDTAGMTSDTVTLTYPTAESNTTQEWAGDACDMCVDCTGNTNGFPRACNPNPHADPNDSTVQIPGLECAWDDRTGTTATCVDRNINAPFEVEDISMYWEGTTSLLEVRVFDYVHYRGANLDITAVTTTGERVELSRVYTPSEAWDAGHMVSRGAFDASETADIDYLEVLVSDNGYPSSTTETATVVDWVDYVAPTDVGAGDECDLNGWDNVCEAPSVCSPTLSGIAGCLDSEAPELIGVDSVYTAGFFPATELDFEVYDSNADWDMILVEGFSGPAWEVFSYEGQFAWNPSPFGQQLYSGGVFLQYADWLLEVTAVDADGNESNSMIAQGIPTQAAGEECNTGVCGFRGCSPPASFCDVDLGDTCALGADTPVCEANEAPVISDATIRRTGLTSYVVEFSGTDLNGDAKKVMLVQEEDGVAAAKHVNLAWDLPIEGASSFISNFTGSMDDPNAVVNLSFTLKDYGFGESNAIELTVPPIVEAGDTCSGDDTVDRCVDGAECIDGTCFAYEPQLADATISWENFGRDAIVTITGLDDYTGADMQLKRAYVTIAGVTTEKSMSRYNTDWTGNSFSFEMSIKDLGTGALVGERFMDVVIEDLGGFNDAGVYFITPHVGLGDTCDVDGAANTCHAGLACDAGTCINDAADTCAGVTLTAATSDTETWLFESSGSGLDTYADYASCGGTNNPNGKEHVYTYTATQTGTLSVVSTSTDGDAHPGFLFARIGECVNAEAVVACSNNLPNGSTIGPNTVEVAVVAGDVVYVTVDGPSWKKGGGNLTFSYL